MAQTPDVRQQAQKRRHFCFLVVAVHVRPAQLGVHVALRRRDVQVAHHYDLPGAGPVRGQAQSHLCRCPARWQACQQALQL